MCNGGEDVHVSVCRPWCRERRTCEDNDMEKMKKKKAEQENCDPEYSLPDLPMPLALTEKYPQICSIVNSSADNSLLCSSRCDSDWTCRPDTDPSHMYPTGLVASVCMPRVSLTPPKIFHLSIREGDCLPVVGFLL